MLKSNEERNTSIYNLWCKGYTIDEISLKTEIPRSSVGYYVKKFRRKQTSVVDATTKSYASPDKEKDEMNPYNRLNQDINAALAFLTCERVMKYFREEEYDKAIKAYEAYKTIYKILADSYSEIKKCKLEVEDALLITGFKNFIRTGVLPKWMNETIIKTVMKEKKNYK